jgi:hypothetical protein
MRPDADAVRDGLALIEAVHRGDLEGTRVLLSHGSPRVIAVALATIADGLIGDLAEWNRLEPCDVLARLREWGAD